MKSPLVRKLSLATHLTEADEAVLNRLTERLFKVPRKTDVIEEGDRPDDVHLILEGIAYRYKLVSGGHRQILALMLPGDFCDLHVALLREMDHSIATLTECTMVRIPRTTIDELIEHHPRITRALWWATLVDEAILRENIAGLGQREAHRQMAHMFCELSARLETVGLVDDGAFDLPFTQEELGDMLGISTVHANRTLKELRARRLVDFERGRVQILDLDRLQAYAGFRPNYLHLSGTEDETERLKWAHSETQMIPLFQMGIGHVPKAPPKTSLTELSDRKVLVVEDEYFAAEELVAAIRHMGATVVGPVANVHDALAIIQRGDVISAAILDINLGGTKVFPVAQALQDSGIPIVFVTGYDESIVPKEYKGVPVFNKPANSDNVVQRLFRH